MSILNNNMKNVLYLTKQNKKAAALPGKGKGQLCVPRAQLPSERALFKYLVQNTTKTFFQVGTYSNVKPGEASFWRVKKHWAT